MKIKENLYWVKLGGHFYPSLIRHNGSCSIGNESVEGCATWCGAEARTAELRPLSFWAWGSSHRKFAWGRAGCSSRGPSGTTHPDAISPSNFPKLGSGTIMNVFLLSVPWEYFEISVFEMLELLLFGKGWRSVIVYHRCTHLESKTFPCLELSVEFCLMQTVFPAWIWSIWDVNKLMVWNDITTRETVLTSSKNENSFRLLILQCGVILLHSTLTR